MAGKRQQLIDAHVHLPLGIPPFQWFPFSRRGNDFYDYLKSTGVTRFLAFSLGGNIQKNNRNMLRAWRQHPKLIIPTVHVDVKFPDDAIAELRRYRELGLVWVTEQVAYFDKFSYTDPAFERILAAAAELEMIVNVHLGQNDFPLFEQFFKRYRKLDFVVAHLADNKQMVIDKAAFVKPFKNVCLDLSGSGVDRLGLWEYVIRTVGAERVLWGSDYPINDPAIYVARLNSARVSAAEKKLIRGENLLRLMKTHGAVIS